MDIWERFELIPNGSPNFLTKSAKRSWDQFNQMTPIDAPSTDDNQNPQKGGILAREKKLKKTLLQDTQIPKKNVAKKKVEGVDFKKKVAAVQSWWDSVVENRSSSSRQNTSNDLPEANTILGAANRDTTLVRIRSVDDTDLLISSDTVSHARPHLPERIGFLLYQKIRRATRLAP